ncbi:MAG: tetratricopeptide repeat protein [Omnitrophica bacterium]|nr:tetratricopeptide repeat protein [Candidatus Omnitrophota bacterium]
MDKTPSGKSLLSLILFTVIISFACSYLAWAYLLDEAREYHFKGDKLQSEGKLDAAVKYYQKAIGIDKNYLAAYNGLAICYEKKGLISRAERWYLKALKVDPHYAPAHYNLGLFYEKYGKIGKAIYHWKARARLGHPAEPAGIKARAKLKKYAPEELQEIDARNLARRIMGQKEKDALDKILGRNKYRTSEEKIQDYYLGGMQHYQEGDYQGAQEYFYKMIEALPLSKPIEK